MPIRVNNYQIEVEFKVSLVVPLFFRRTHVDFASLIQINGKGHSLFGDGFAMWLTKDRAQTGPVFGSVDYFTGLAVFLDT
jgi:mannose-binding lectin 2